MKLPTVLLQWFTEKTGPTRCRIGHPSCLAFFCEPNLNFVCPLLCVCVLCRYSVDAVDNGFDTSADDSTVIVSVTWSDDVMTCRHGHHFGLGCHGRRLITRTVVGHVFRARRISVRGVWSWVVRLSRLLQLSTVGCWKPVTGHVFDTSTTCPTCGIGIGDGAARVMPRSERGLRLSQRSLTGTSSSVCNLPVCRSGDNCDCKFGASASSLPVGRSGPEV
jgi:hypothetical protein